MSREALRQEDARDMRFEVLDVTPPRGATQITPTARLVPPLGRVPTASPGSWSPVFCGDPVSGATVQWHPWPARKEEPRRQVAGDPGAPAPQGILAHPAVPSSDSVTKR